MPVNQTLATFSDTAFYTAFVIYLLALVLSLIYYVKMPGVIDARRTRERVADKELVTAGTSVSSTGDTIDADDVVLSDTELADKEAAADKWGGMTQSLIWLGAVIHIAAAVLRGLATGRFPLGNMYLGNTILLKDAEICPRSALAVQQIMDDAGIPVGVYNNVFATHDQVARIIADPRIQGVSLTGSERAGSIIGAHAGKNLKKAVLELGGSDPYVILDSKDIRSAARLAWATRMYNTGQACNSNK